MLSLVNLKEDEISFTQKCILLTSLSQETNIILLTPFNNIPFVKLYTAIPNSVFIYSKIKGALCLFNKKKSIGVEYILRIYDLKTYSIIFNIVLRKQDFNYFNRLKDTFYYLTTRNYYLGFKFMTKESGEIFFTQLKGEPNKNIIYQNEKAYNLKNKELENHFEEVRENIKEELEKIAQQISCKTQASINSKNNNKRSSIKIINSSNNDSYDFKDISELDKMFNNMYYDKEESKLNIFINDKTMKKKLEKLVNLYNINKRKDFVIRLIDKDFTSILNKNNYVDLMVNHLLVNMEEEARQKNFKRKITKKLYKKLDKKQNLKNNNPINSYYGGFIYKCPERYKKKYNRISENNTKFTFNENHPWEKDIIVNSKNLERNSTNPNTERGGDSLFKKIGNFLSVGNSKKDKSFDGKSNIRRYIEKSNNRVITEVIEENYEKKNITIESKPTIRKIIAGNPQKLERIETNKQKAKMKKQLTSTYKRNDSLRLSRKTSVHKKKSGKVSPKK